MQINKYFKRKQRNKYKYKLKKVKKCVKEFCHKKSAARKIRGRQAGAIKQKIEEKTNPTTICN